MEWHLKKSMCVKISLQKLTKNEHYSLFFYNFARHLG